MSRLTSFDRDVLSTPKRLRVRHRAADRSQFDMNDASTWWLFSHPDSLSMMERWGGIAAVVLYPLSLRQSKLGLTDRLVSLSRHFVRCLTITTRCHGPTPFTLRGNRDARRHCPMIRERMRALKTCYDYILRNRYSAEGGDCLTASELASFSRGPRTQPDWVKHALSDCGTTSSRVPVMVAPCHRRMESLRLDCKGHTSGWLPPCVAVVDAKRVPNRQDDMVLSYLARTLIDTKRWVWPAELHHAVLVNIASQYTGHVLCSG